VGRARNINDRSVQRSVQTGDDESPVMRHADNKQVHMETIQALVKWVELNFKSDKNKMNKNFQIESNRPLLQTE